MLARNLTVNLYTGGANWGAQIAKFIKSVKYSDTIEEKADTVEIVLADNEHQFLKGGLPPKGTEVSIEIVKHNWNSQDFANQSSLKLPLGTFEVDAVKYQFPPSQLVLKLNSIPAKAELRGIARNKSWEETTLQRIAADIAGRAGLQLFYDADEVEIKRAEQSDEADLPFLLRLCKNAGLNLKVADKKLIIFEALKYENKSPVIVLDYNNNPPIILKLDAETTANAIYQDAQVNYKSNNVAEWLWALFGGNDFFQSTANIAGLTDGGGAGVLNINEKVNNEAEAQRLARGKLREENKKEWKLTLNLMGSFSFLAGNVFELRGYGIYNGRYICDSTNHTMGENGYTTQVTAHKCLKGY